MSRVLLVAILASAMGASSNAAISPYYAVTDLGSLGGPSSALALNSFGQVVGTSLNATNEQRAFVWSRSGGMVELPHLGGGAAVANDINDLGQIVGGSATAGYEQHAVLWQPGGAVVDLNPSSGIYSTATAINNHGLAVLQTTPTPEAVDPIEVIHIVYGTGMTVWSQDDGFRNYRTLGGLEAMVWDINDQYDMAVSWFGAGLDPQPVMWHHLTGLWFLEPELTSPGPESFLLAANTFAVNAEGAVVGAVAISDAPGYWRAFWALPEERRVGFDMPRYGSRGVEIASLGFDTYAYGIDGALVVGASRIAEGGDELDMRAFIWDVTKKVTIDLNDLLISRDRDWLLLGAYDVAMQESGAHAIVGYGINPDGEQRAFLLTPIPEPATLLLLAAAGKIMALSRKSRRNDARRTVARRPSSRLSRAGGYTVLELAVTMSITVGAFGLLVPAIGTAKQSVTQSSCMTKAKGLTQANLNYAADYGKCVPDYRGGESRPPRSVAERAQSWFGALEHAYLGGDLTRVDCPVVNRHRWANYDSNAGEWVWPVDYAINRFGLNSSPDIADDPSRNVMFAEPNLPRATIYNIGEVMAFYLWWGDDPANRSDMEQWRVGSLSFGFVDGHASRVAIPSVKIPFLEPFPELSLAGGSPLVRGNPAVNLFWWNESQVRSGNYSSPVFPDPHD